MPPLPPFLLALTPLQAGVDLSKRCAMPCSLVVPPAARAHALRKSAKLFKIDSQEQNSSLAS